MISKYIGNTPLVRLKRIEEHLDLGAELYAKLEKTNPSGSVKDRAALYILSSAMREGKIKPGGEIAEATSGNMGISLAMLSAAWGIKCNIFMPENMSVERVKIMRGYGARLILTDHRGGMRSAVEAAEKYAIEQGAYMPNQFTNSESVRSHYETTGVEIYRQMLGKVDIFTCGVGTSGTFSGTGRYLKAKIPTIKTVAVEPSESAVLSGGALGVHGISGIGAGFVLALFDRPLCDEIVRVSTEEAAEMTSLSARCEGLLVGLSSGAALFSAILLAKRKENRGKRIVTVFPDGGERYLSSLSV